MINNNQNQYFNFFINGQAKPQHLFVNKGIVRVVNSAEPFWVKWHSNDTPYVHSQVNNGTLSIDTSKDNVQITYNIAGLDKCNVKLDLGTLEIKDLCQKTTASVSTGTMKVYANKQNTGNIEANVLTGSLHNNSNLTAQNHQAHNGFNNVFSGANFLGGEVKLAGDLQNHDAKFNVHIGTIDISNPQS